MNRVQRDLTSLCSFNGADPASDAGSSRSSMACARTNCLETSGEGGVEVSKSSGAMLNVLTSGASDCLKALRRGCE
jgi:hypothetical protein